MHDLKLGGTEHRDGVKRMHDGRRRQQLITFYSKQKNQKLSTLGLDFSSNQNKNVRGIREWAMRGT